MNSRHQISRHDVYQICSPPVPNLLGCVPLFWINSTGFGTDGTDPGRIMVQIIEICVFENSRKFHSLLYHWYRWYGSIPGNRKKSQFRVNLRHLLKFGFICAFICTFCPSPHSHYKILPNQMLNKRRVCSASRS